MGANIESLALPRTPSPFGGRPLAHLVAQAGRHLAVAQRLVKRRNKLSFANSWCPTDMLAGWVCMLDPPALHLCRARILLAWRVAEAAAELEVRSLPLRYSASDVTRKDHARATARLIF